MVWQEATTHQLIAIGKRCDQLGWPKGEERARRLREITETDPDRLSKGQASDLLTALYMEYEP
jgi:hypothetical protein